jgi:tRNA modification GTPase
VQVDTASVILAVGSPPGHSGRGMIRASGSGAFDLIDAMATVDVPRTRGVGAIRLSEAGLGLPAMLIRCPGPSSYTGEDVFELQLPGQPVLLERVIDRLITVGAGRGVSTRRAEPGEYTARAWYSGRLSLTEAEGVAAVIAARSDAELRAAALLKTGRLGTVAAASADRIAGMLALVEAGIDFTDEEDVVAIEPAELLRRIGAECEQLQDLLERSVGMEVLQALPTVVLCGPPNAGKSTLFNALLRHRRAVVAELAGTTRDAIIEPMAVDDRGAEVLLVDAAGIDEDGGSVIARRMQQMTRSVMNDADVLLHCLPHDSDDEWIDDPRVVRVRTKHDLCERSDDADVRVSAMDGHGLDRMRAVIADRTLEQAVHLGADAVALQPRHEAALGEALESLHAARAMVEDRPESTELVALHLRSALDVMAILAGTIAPDDVLGRVFASFCIGK